MFLNIKASSHDTSFVVVLTNSFHEIYLGLKLSAPSFRNHPQVIRAGFVFNKLSQQTFRLNLKWENFSHRRKTRNMRWGIVEFFML